MFLALKPFASDGFMKRLIAAEIVSWIETNICKYKFNIM